MKISVYQEKRKDKEGMMAVYIVVNNMSKKVTLSSGVKTLYPLTKVGGYGVGVVMNKKEPQGRLKMKRLEAFYNKVEEYCAEHPDMRVAAIKTALTGAEGAGGSRLVSVMESYAASGKVSDSSAEIIKRTARKVAEYDPKAGFNIDECWLDGFVEHLRVEGAKVNGIGLHLRNIRTAFNWARKKRMTKEYPFLDYQIKVERQSIRNMTLEQLRAFRTYNCEPWQVEYRDVFMLMVYLAGVNAGDLFTCTGLTNGRLEYRRRKTEKPISVVVHPAAMELIEKYKGVDFLINPCDRYKDYHGYLHRMNDGLKKIGECKIVPDKLGKMRKKEIVPFFEGLSTYVARYTFASVAAEIGIQRDVIAACLGHSWADVTSHYVAYSQKQIDDAVNKVVDAISGTKE